MYLVGLLGHSVEMASSSNVTFEIDVNAVPYVTGALEMAKMGLVPAGTYANKGYLGQEVNMEGIEEFYLDALFDPQTSGGLLVSLPEKELDSIMKAFEQKALDTKVAVDRKSVV